MRTQCPLCGSRNTYQHSDNQIYEEHMIAQASFRCGKCKKYFFIRFQLSQPEYKFHRYITHTYENGHYEQVLNPKRDDPPNTENDTRW